METTPSSTRRITRSQTRAASTKNNNLILSRNIEEPPESTAKSEQMSASKKQPQDRMALIDITNDSPIVGVAMGKLETPSSAASKKRAMSRQARYLFAPGSGEALLRGQVKTLLQKVEEDAELPKNTLESRPLFDTQGLIRSPINLLAPTPANTPQVLNFSDSVNDDVLLASITPLIVTGIVRDQKNQESADSTDGITRSLLLDFSEKSESSDRSSVLSYQGTTLSGEAQRSGEKIHTDDDGSSSIWSIQANARSAREDDYEEEGGECEEEYYDDEEDDDYGNNDDDDDDGLLLDELCEGLSKVSVGGGEMAKFTGKRIRFVYNSDDELQGEEEICGEERSDLHCGGVLHLKGLPSPKGKHLHFRDQESEV